MADSYWGRFKACIHHPQTVVRIAAWLGAIGAALGLVGVVLGGLSFIPRDKSSEPAQPLVRTLDPTKYEQLVLFAVLSDGYLVGKVFNQDSAFVITRLTVEAVPKDETNIFNRGSPRFFEVPVRVLPRTMSSEFRVETGPLSPEFHTLRIVSAIGFDRKE